MSANSLWVEALYVLYKRITLGNTGLVYLQIKDSFDHYVLPATQANQNLTITLHISNYTKTFAAKEIYTLFFERAAREICLLILYWINQKFKNCCTSVYFFLLNLILPWYMLVWLTGCKYIWHFENYLKSTSVRIIKIFGFESI